MRVFWSLKSTRKTKFLYDSSRANNVRPLSRRRRPSLLRKSVNSRPTIELKSRQQPKQEIKSFIPPSRRRQHTCFAYVLIPAFSFDEEGAKEKAIKKQSAEMKFRALRSATRATCPCPSRLLKKAGENFWVAGENFNYGALKLHYSARKL